MGEQHIKITQLFNAPVDTIFSLLTDHETFGQVINAKITKAEWNSPMSKSKPGLIIRLILNRNCPFFFSALF